MKHIIDSAVQYGARRLHCAIINGYGLPNFKNRIFYRTEKGSSHMLNFIFLSPSVFSRAHVNKNAYLSDQVN
jgi:hypothetical protein